MSETSPRLEGIETFDPLVFVTVTVSSLKHRPDLRGLRQYVAILDELAAVWSETSPRLEGIETASSLYSLSFGT